MGRYLPIRAEGGPFPVKAKKICDHRAKLQEELCRLVLYESLFSIPASESKPDIIIYHITKTCFDFNLPFLVRFDQTF